MDEKVVYILGAGASIDHSVGFFPDINSIFLKGVEKNIIKNPLLEYRELIDYIKEKYAVDMTEGNVKINAENVYTSIEITKEHDLEYGVILEKQFQEFIITLFDSLHKEKEAEIKSGSYSKLQKILRWTDTIITFNWDILLDNILDRKKIIEEHIENKETIDMSIEQYIQYLQFFQDLSIYSVQIWEHVAPSPPNIKTEKFTKGTYLKLHGSIDWKVCPNESCRAYGLICPVLGPLTEILCGECREKLSPLIIPPGLNKPIGKIFPVRRLWNFAIDEIHNAEIIIIWGYSYPPTDFYADWLFREGRKSKNLKEVIVINPEVEKQEYRAKFEDIYQGISVKFNYFKNFNEWKVI